MTFKDWLDFALKVFALVVALGAFSVALYTTTLGPKNTLHSERIKLAAKALDSTNAYGWELGTFVGKDDQRAFTNEELHSGEPDKIVVLFNGATADLISLELILPDDFTGQIRDLKSLLLDVQMSFQNGRFSELAAKFGAYRTKVDNLRGRLRAFLV
jgi:hypothetical protein